MNTIFRRTVLAAGLMACALAVQAQLKPATPGKAAPAPAPAAADDIVSNPEFEQAGKIAAQAWLLLLDRNDWGTAWDVSSAVFHRNVPLGTWMDNVPKLRQPLGALVERTPGEPIYKKSAPGLPPGDYVTTRFTSKFANREVVELVTTVREPDGRWRVTGYRTQ